MGRRDQLFVRRVGFNRFPVFFQDKMLEKSAFVRNGHRIQRGVHHKVPGFLKGRQRLFLNGGRPGLRLPGLSAGRDASGCVCAVCCGGGVLSWKKNPQTVKTKTESTIAISKRPCSMMTPMISRQGKSVDDPIINGVDVMTAISLG